MTKRQLNHAIRIIRRDCHAQGFYIDTKTGETCAIAALALAAGCSKRSLASNNATVTALPKLARAIRRKFGLMEGIQALIQRTNDCEPLLDQRRRRIVNILQASYDHQTKPNKHQ